MTERTYTALEAKALAKEAAMQALQEFATLNTIPSALSSEEAAKKMGISVRTLARLKPPRNGNSIPASWVLQRLKV